MLPEIGISDFGIAEMPKIGNSDSRNAEYRHFGPPISDNKRIILFCSTYIKASEFQCSSVYHWNSLVKDLCFWSTKKIATIYNYITSCSLLQRNMFST